ncbi:MAG: hypothetical protein HY319_01075 [Armatimonadetes bacterium]|nr:hypothetical protein [Armatimonadota bacterium]
MEELGGLQETPKFCLVLALDRFRTRLLEEAARLVACGGLDEESSNFDVTLEDLATPGCDLRATARRRRQERERLARFPLPTVFDSGADVPSAAASGVLRRSRGNGRVGGGGGRALKNLASPDEKPLLPGDVLVARATQPGWTPLFVNAAAVVLEVGGVLQHGAPGARVRKALRDRPGGGHQPPWGRWTAARAWCAWSRRLSQARDRSRLASGAAVLSRSGQPGGLDSSPAGAGARRGAVPVEPGFAGGRPGP